MYFILSSASGVKLLKTVTVVYNIKLGCNIAHHILEAKIEIDQSALACFSFHRL